MNRKTLITYDDKTGEILHEKEIKSWSGMDLITIKDLSIDDANDVIGSIQWRQRRVQETMDQLLGAIIRSEVLNKEEKKELIQFITE